MPHVQLPAIVMAGSWGPGLPEQHPGRSVLAKREVSHHGSCPLMGSWAAALHSPQCMSIHCQWSHTMFSDLRSGDLACTTGPSAADEHASMTANSSSLSVWFMPVTMQQHAAMQGMDVGHLAPREAGAIV